MGPFGLIFSIFDLLFSQLSGHLTITHSFISNKVHDQTAHLDLSGVLGQDSLFNTVSVGWIVVTIIILNSRTAFFGTKRHSETL